MFHSTRTKKRATHTDKLIRRLPVCQVSKAKFCENASWPVRSETRAKKGSLVRGFQLTELEGSSGRNNGNLELHIWIPFGKRMPNDKALNL